LSSKILDSPSFPALISTKKDAFQIDPVSASAIFGRTEQEGDEERTHDLLDSVVPRLAPILLTLSLLRLTPSASLELGNQSVEVDGSEVGSFSFLFQTEPKRERRVERQSVSGSYLSLFLFPPSSSLKPITKKDLRAHLKDPP